MPKKPKGFVAEYLAYERDALDAEAVVEEYIGYAEDYRWKQVRTAHDAIESGEFTRKSFAVAVQKSDKTIGRQVRVWAKYAEAPSTARPSYGDAMAQIEGDSVTEGWARKNRSAARQVLSDPDEVEKLLSSPAVARSIETAQAKVRERSAPKRQQPEPTGSNRAFLECAGDMLKAEQSLARLIENLNEGRRNGYLTPSVLREFTAKLRNYADAVDEIAASRGLTDEALAEWIGAGE